MYTGDPEQIAQLPAQTEQSQVLPADWQTKFPTLKLLNIMYASSPFTRVLLRGFYLFFGFASSP